MNDKIPFLSTPLPEDIERYIHAGFLRQASALIDRRLETLSSAADLPLKNRLELEKFRLRQLPDEFPYSYSEALSLVRRSIPTSRRMNFRRLKRTEGLIFSL